MGTRKKATMTAAPIPSANIQQNSEICKFAKPQLCDEFCERDVIAACLMYTNLFDGLTADLFHTPLCHNIFDISMQIIAAGNKPDIVSVAEFSSKHNMGITPQDLMSLTNNPTPDLTFGQNLELLRLLAARRKMQTVAYLLDETATNKSLDIADTLTKAQEQLNEIAEAAQPKADDYFIDITKNYPEPPFLFYKDSVGFMPCGDISAVKAKSKNGKSHFCAILAAALLGGRTFDVGTQEQTHSILWCDTEQAIYNTAKLLRKIYALAGLPTDRQDNRIKVIYLRPKTPKERMRIISREAKRLRPTLVIIDGVADVCENFNDVTESGDTINELMRISAEYNCHILCVLHENKSKDDEGMKGHLGTLLLQKASDVWQVKKDGDVFTATQTDTRNQPCDPVSFKLDENGVPIKATAFSKSDEQLARLVGEVFADGKPRTHTQLIHDMMLCGAFSASTAKRRVSDAKARGLICVNLNDGSYYAK